MKTLRISLTVSTALPRKELVARALAGLIAGGPEASALLDALEAYVNADGGHWTDEALRAEYLARGSYRATARHTGLAASTVRARVMRAANDNATAAAPAVLRRVG